MGQVVGTPLIAAGMAAGAVIALMSLGRCLHPPGGACALLCALGATGPEAWGRSEEHTSELQSLMRTSYAVFCLKTKNTNETTHVIHDKPYTNTTHRWHELTQ